ncbi:MAG: LptE family protein [Candidatus Cloacimonetes bacterium]|nr:LptE family protein [Candidatus Cloacimonadota bacterium]
MIRIIITYFIAFLTGCSYSVYSSGYPHLKTITVNVFTNQTTQYNLEQDLLLDLSDRFLKDGRLQIVGISPDCQLEGEILDYTNKIWRYSETGVEEYEVRILFKVVFTDLVKNEIIYRHDTLSLREVYAPNSDNEGDFTTEEAAQREIYRKLFETIIRISLDEW